MPFIQALVTSCEAVKNKDNLKVVTVNIGESEDLTIVTNASNIRLDTKTVVATIGSEVDCNGETITVKKTNVGGIMSNGMICDSVMLGWSGGSAGTCVNLEKFPDFKIGDPSPKEKPRGIGGGATETNNEPELSAKELKAIEKEKRKAELAKKKADRKAKKGEEDSKGDDDKDEEEISSTLAKSEITDDI